MRDGGGSMCPQGRLASCTGPPGGDPQLASAHSGPGPPRWGLPPQFFPFWADCPLAPLTPPHSIALLSLGTLLQEAELSFLQGGVGP